MSATLTALSPAAVFAGASDTTVTISGTGFTLAMSAYAQTSPSSGSAKLTTTFVSSTGVTAVIPYGMLTTDGELFISVDTAPPTSASQTLEFLITGSSAGIITVVGDGTYSGSPALGPFGQPQSATSLAQALFEANFPGVLGQIPPPTQAQVVDASTSPVTTVKGRVMTGIADTQTATAAALVRYLAPNYVAPIPTDGAAGTAIAESVAWVVPVACVIGSLLFIPNGAVSASGSSYATLTIRSRRSGTPTVVATASTASTSWSAFTPISLMGPFVVEAGDVWTFQLAKTGSGALVGGGALQAFVQ